MNVSAYIIIHTVHKGDFMAFIADKLRRALNFNVAANGSTHGREFIAGLSMFLATAYTIVVIPGMLADAGMPLATATTCVILMVALGTAAMGIFGRLPMVLAPGLGGASLVAYTLVAYGGVDYSIAMGIVFWSGFIFLVLTIFGIRSIVTRVIPDSIRLAIGPAIGIFIAFIGARSAGLVVAGENSLQLGHLASATGILTILGVAGLVALNARKIPGSFIIVIAVITVIGIPLGLTTLDGSVFGLPASPASLMFDIDFVNSLSPEYFPYLFAFFASEFFSSTGVIMTVTDHIDAAKSNTASTSSTESTESTDLTRPFLVDSAAIMGGSLFGSPSVTTYIESAVGAEAGGRTGLASLWAALFFVVLLVATPLASAIPDAATAPVVIVIGLMIMSGFRRVTSTDPTEFIPASIVLICTLLWGNFGTGIAAGLLAYVLIKLAAGKWRDVHLGMWIMTPFLIYFFMAIE